MSNAGHVGQLNGMRALSARYAADLLGLHQLADAWLDSNDDLEIKDPPCCAGCRLALKLREMRENVAPMAPPPGYLRAVTAEGKEHTIRAKAIVDVSETTSAPGPAAQVSIRLVTGQVAVVLGPKWVVEEAMRLALTPPPEVAFMPLGGRGRPEMIGAQG